MMGYGNCDARQAGKDNRVCEEWMVTVLGLYLNVCGIYCENLWYYRVLAGIIECVGIIMVSFRRYWVMDWVNPRILSIQSLEAHHRVGQGEILSVMDCGPTTVPANIFLSYMRFMQHCQYIIKSKDAITKGEKTTCRPRRPCLSSFMLS